MSRTVAQFKSDLSRKFHGKNVNKIQGVNEAINEAAREVLREVDFYETETYETIANAIYTDIFSYSVPSLLKTNRIFDIRPQAGRESSDEAHQRFSDDFDKHKLPYTFSVENNKGVRLLKFSAPPLTTQPALLHECDSITANGTWAVGDDATNLTVDTLNYISGSKSLNFDVDGSTTTASLSITDMTAVDCSTYEDKGSIFLWLYCPVAITSATFDWGDDVTTNYWSDTVSSGHVEAFKVGWNLLRFDWDGATENGSPTASSVNALKLAITYDGNADTDYRLDSIVIHLGELYEIGFYSKGLFKNSSGVFQEEISTTDGDLDEIILEGDGYQVMLFKAAQIIAPQIYAEDSKFDLEIYSTWYKDARDQYKQKYPSKVKPPKTQYYKRSSRVINRRGRVSRGLYG